jgi:hypothetical protein
MKCSKNFPKVSPEQYAKARDSIKIEIKTKIMKPIKFRNLAP